MSLYITNGDTSGNINPNAGDGWFRINGGEEKLNIQSVGFQVVLPAGGSPIGTFVFEITDDDNPAAAVLGPTALTLPSSMAAGQPTDGSARNFLFDFDPAPTALFMRMRYARISGGAVGLYVGIAFSLKEV